MSDRRGKVRDQLCPHYWPYYDSLCGLLPDAWQPVSGMRTFDQQAALYDQGRTLPGPIVTKASPGLSMHNYGLASDWDYFWQDRYTPLQFEDPRWKEYIDAVEKSGLRSISWEKPHNELNLLVKPSSLLLVYNQKGLDGVWAVVAKELSDA